MTMYPFIQARHFTPCAKPREIRIVCVHTAECHEGKGSARGVGNYFASPEAPDASSHAGADAEEIIQYVHEGDIAWHASEINDYSYGIEHAGSANQTAEQWADPFSVAMLERSARLAAEVCQRHGIPVVLLSVDELRVPGAKGFCGHNTVTDAFHAGKGHWDPGPNFPWSTYLTRVQEILDAMEAPTERDLEPAVVDDIPVGLALDGIADAYAQEQLKKDQS